MLKRNPYFPQLGTYGTMLDSFGSMMLNFCEDRQLH